MSYADLQKERIKQAEESQRVREKERKREVERKAKQQAEKEIHIYNTIFKRSEEYRDALGFQKQDHLLDRIEIDIRSITQFPYGTWHYKYLSEYDGWHVSTGGDYYYCPLEDLLGRDAIKVLGLVKPRVRKVLTVRFVLSGSSDVHAHVHADIDSIEVLADSKKQTNEWHRAPDSWTQWVEESTQDKPVYGSPGIISEEWHQLLLRQILKQWPHKNK